MLLLQIDKLARDLYCKHPRPQRNGNFHLWRLKAQKVYCSLRGCIRKNWNDTEKGFFLLANYAIVFAACLWLRAHMTYELLRQCA
jgi:hypothetical protein